MSSAVVAFLPAINAGYIWDDDACSLATQQNVNFFPRFKVRCIAHLRIGGEQGIAVQM